MYTFSKSVIPIYNNGKCLPIKACYDVTLKLSSDCSSIIQLFGHCIGTRYMYAMSRSLVKLTEIGTSLGRGYTVTHKPLISNDDELYFQYNYFFCICIRFLVFNFHGY